MWRLQVLSPSTVWCKEIKLACLRGVYGEWVLQEPVDGAKLAMVLGFGVGKVFDRAAKRCEWWGK